MNDQEFEDYWFNKYGQEEYAEEFEKTVTEDDIKRQPSYPNIENATVEAIWEKAYNKYVKRGKKDEQ